MMELRPVSQAVEDYVKAIYLLEQSEGKVTTKALALALDVAAPSVTAMIKRLHAMHLVRYTRYRGVALTPAGKRMALEVVRHHRLLELYLVEAMGLPWDQVHEEAERLEHVISEELEERIAELLGHPVTDPHGDPIPTKEGQLEHPASVPLAELNPGTAAIVHRIADQSPEKLRYLGSLGLFPKVRVTLLEKAPFGGPMFLEVGKSHCTLGGELARQIHVLPVEAH
ncbi:MAG: metal-dependent transcriptional regulator [candidate division NC10 bacterium]|jgi:DtxR family Mn-dependent transcriptional regulator